MLLEGEPRSRNQDKTWEIFTTNRRVGLVGIFFWSTENGREEKCNEIAVDSDS